MRRIRAGGAAHRQPCFCLFEGSPPAARKEAPWKEELVEGPSHLVREEVISDPFLFPSAALPGPPLWVTLPDIVGQRHPGPPAKGGGGAFLGERSWDRRCGHGSWDSPSVARGGPRHSPPCLTIEAGGCSV